MRSRRERFREWAADQTPVSWAAVAVGSAALIVGVAGTVVLWIARGITPWESIVESALSGTQTAILVAALVLGIAAMAVGFGTYRIMPTKHARETAISGGALGIQATLFAATLLLFRAGENFDLFVRQNMRFELLGDFWRQFVTGARNTVILAAAGEGFGIALGIALALLILSQRVLVRAPARAYINFFRGTPLVWQFSFFFFGIVLGMRLPLSVYQVAILVLSLNAGAYTAEIFRAGIQSIERGQVEAARSLGMSYLQSMGYVVLPQAFRRVIPPLTNEFIILIKDTSLVFVLGLTAEGRELFSVGRDAYGERFNATLYIGTVLGYLAITLPMLRVVTDLERRLRSGLGGFMA